MHRTAAPPMKFHHSAQAWCPQCHSRTSPPLCAAPVFSSQQAKLDASVEFPVRASEE
ncbi:uncharacterized protein BO95DRAFT_442880 [Aspergillus brunneoviolaceus CBS 621.78]|uniref:Uncharacterized protein n=1 Tax=Aspergillus brunneoviolaceus CBS 621.78 TaxID=1450534 RepID=A0ACD1G906_9EURO|nr:hypothetical protein BO95DRAFT_442880 [Aspergillus brunneoviolaceus CBS 621.78]RAH45765.1 hypothetical protein BO95DRAFT_442880 [Aspergillus brunneoviolaceus CBS 621.78]